MIRRKRNMVHRLKMDDGSWCSDGRKMGEIAQDYFKSLFARDPCMPRASLPPVAVARLSEATNFLLTLPVEKEEVRAALMSIKSFKAPGPDGLQPFFYKT